LRLSKALDKFHRCTPRLSRLRQDDLYQLQYLGTAILFRPVFEPCGPLDDDNHHSMIFAGLLLRHDGNRRRIHSVKEELPTRVQVNDRHNRGIV
jgi:hypothetical protein